jgi:probable rRNA maturation factor
MSVSFRKQLPGISVLSLSRFLSRAKVEARVSGEVNVLVTGSSEMRKLNRDFRGKDKTTDVLSFPSPSGKSGDIAISWDIALENARKLGHSPSDELKILILHGTLHLAGHDHERDNGAMRNLEQRLRVKLRLPNSLIERTVGQQTPEQQSVRRRRG